MRPAASRRKVQLVSLRVGRRAGGVSPLSSRTPDRGLTPPARPEPTFWNRPSDGSRDLERPCHARRRARLPVHRRIPPRCQRTARPLAGQIAVVAGATRGAGRGIARVFGLGCFWGAERKFWLGDGIYTTAVGYAGGSTPNPTMKKSAAAAPATPKSCSSSIDPKKISYDDAAARVLGKPQSDPGHASGQRCRHAVPLGDLHVSPAQRKAADASGDLRQGAAGERLGPITTEIADAGEFYFAEDYHQQYLAKNPAGYCGLGGTGVSCPIGVAAAAS